MRSTIWKKSTVKLSTRSWKIGARAEPGDGFGAVTERASAFAEERNLCTPASRSSLLCSRSTEVQGVNGFARPSTKSKGSAMISIGRGRVGASLSRPVPPVCC